MICLFDFSEYNLMWRKQLCFLSTFCVTIVAQQRSKTVGISCRLNINQEMETEGNGNKYLGLLVLHTDDVW